MEEARPQGPSLLAVALVAALVAGAVGAVAGAVSALLLGAVAFHEDEAASRTRGVYGQDVSVGLTSSEPWREIEFDVPDDAVAVRLRAVSSAGPVELSARFGDLGSSDDLDWDDWAEASEEPVLDLSDPGTQGFDAGPLVVRVESHRDLVDDESLHVRVRATVVRARTDATIRAGESWSGATDAEWGFRRTVAVRVPEGATALRVDLADAPTDLDLYVSADALPVRTADAALRRTSPAAAEWLVLDDDSRPRLPQGATVWVAVVDPVRRRYSVPFRLVTTVGREPPDALVEFPPLVAPADPRARAVLCVVELITDDGGGSGTFIAPGGRILTAYHVVEAAARHAAGGREGEEPQVVVAVPLEPERVARDLFLARVVQADHERDLALLQVVSGVRGEPLPAGYEFPSVAEQRRGELTLGETLHTVGFPSAGGTDSRAPVTVSRGVVSGHARAARGVEIKTDAFISPGSSGGAAFDGSWRFVGVPVSISDESGPVLGFVVPADAVPPDWLR